MVIKSGHVVEQDSYTVDEIAGAILQIAIKHKYIKRENLTARGETLVSEAEKCVLKDDLHCSEAINACLRPKAGKMMLS